jgi:hypothetical protein
MNRLANKDSATFYSLFAMDSVSFYGVNSTDTYQTHYKKYPKFQLIQKDNYRTFMKMVASSNKKAEEKCNNLNIWRDNTIATLSFNYGFWLDNKETNWGIETWELLFNGKDWKIMSALFSINDVRVTADPETKN